MRANDKAGNRSSWITGTRITPQLVQSDAATLSGGWQHSKDTAAIGDEVTTTTGTGPTARLHFHGSAIGVVASRGPRSGKVRVLVDGHAVRTVDLWARKAKDRRVVFVRSWAGDGSHWISVEALGTDRQPKVELDAFVVLQ